jgi:hypothetical protein
MTKNAAERLVSRFEEGKPADPTENMSEADAKKWREEHEKNKDQFKAAADPAWKEVAERLMAARKGSTQDDLHYRAYMRAVAQGQPTKHLVEQYKGAKDAQADLIDEAGKAPKKASALVVATRFMAVGQERSAARQPKDPAERHQLKVLLDTLKMPSAMAGVMGGPGAKEAERILRDKFKYTDAEIRRLKQAKTAGFSHGSESMSVLFVEGAKPVPFNADTIQDINRTTIPIIGDDGEEHDVNLKFVRQESSGPLTHGQEKLGWKREVRVDIEYPVDEEGSPTSSERAALTALARLGKKHGFTVVPVKRGYRPQTRKTAAEEAPKDELKDDQEEWLAPQKRGEWNLIISKYSATRWQYFLKNPHGGGSGSSSYPTLRAAFAAGTRPVAWGEPSVNPGKKKIWVIEQVWDFNKEDYVVKKSYWWDIPADLLGTKFRKPSREELMHDLGR